MQPSPKIVPLSTDVTVADHRLPFEITPAQLPLVHAVLDWLPQPVAFIDTAGLIKACNDAFCQALNAAREALLDHAFSAFTQHWADAAAHAAQAALRDACHGQATAFVLHDQLLAQCQPQRDENGVVRGCLVYGVPLPSHATHEQMRTLVEALPTPASILDTHLHFEYANQAALNERGMTSEQVLGKHIGDTLDADAYAFVKTYIDQALAGQRISYERKVQYPDGQTRWISRTLVPRRGADGKIDGVFVFGNDIDAYRSEQEQLANQQAEIRAFVDSLPLAVGLLDIQGKFTLVNHGFCRLLRRGESSVISRPLGHVLGGELGALVMRYFEGAVEGQTVEYEYLDRKATPAPRWRRIRLVPRRVADGEVGGVFVIALDVHEEKTARAAIEARERQVREFADNIPEPLAYIEADGRFGFVNRAFADMVSQSQSTVVNRPLEDFTGHALIGDVREQFERAKRGEPLIEERLLRLPNGARRWIEMRWLPDRLVGHQSRIRGAYLICPDVTEAREARAAHEKTVAETERTLNSIDTPVAIVDSDMKFSFANKSMLDWYELEREQFVGRPVRELMDPKYYEQSLPYMEKALSGEEISFMREFRFSDDTIRWVRIRYVPRRNEQGQTNGFYVVVFDIHDLKTQQRMLQLKQEELRRASWLLSSHLDNSPLAALELDADLRIRRWSERAERLFGWRRGEVIGRSIWELNLVAPDESDALGRSFALVLTVKQQRVSSLQRISRQDGAKLWCEWYLSALLDEQGELVSIFALVHDVNQRVEAEARLQQLAAFDSLTGLPNRSSLQFELAQALDRAQRANTGAAALFIDLDHFKNVNDTLGHRVGDQLLLAVARILKSCVRKRDVVSRMGGDEFMIVIEDANVRSAAQHVANKLLSALNQPIPVEGHMLTVAASVGIAVFPDHGADANILLKNSDVAMYHAKERGKGRFEFYSDELAREREEQALIEFSLRVAMASNQLTLNYQPRVSCRDGSIDGAEVLLRWRHPELGDVPPKKFIRVAEETGLIFELGTWVFRRACMQLRDWQRRQIPIKTLSINFSARQLLMNDLVERIGAVLIDTGCDPRLLEIEITETSMLFDLTVTKRVVSSLKKLGLRIAIDDFGTGFSSLSHLQQLDIDALKIDQSFVRDLLQDSGDAAITRTVISLGRGLGLQVIAEGVENARQLAFLQHCGCDLYQGYHFSPAVNVDQFEALVHASR